MTQPKGVPGLPIAILLAGGIFAYAALKGKSVGNTARALIQGDNPSGLPTITPIGTAYDPSTNGGYAADSNAVGVPLSAADQSVGSGGSPAANKAIGRTLAAPYGWATGAQWQALDNLWTRESGWSNTAENSSSGALGIAQALPPTKYPPAAQKPTLSASAQISWGLAYIKQRYGDPVTAWAHETANSWY